MLIKAITLFRLRAVGDFLFAFCSLINIDEAPVCHFKTNFKTKSWHTLDFLPTVLVHLRQTVFKWILSKPAVCTYFVCIWSFGHARSSKCALLVSCLSRTHISAWGTASLVWIVHSTFYYQTCPGRHGHITTAACVQIHTSFITVYHVTVPLSGLNWWEN